MGHIAGILLFYALWFFGRNLFSTFPCLIGVFCAKFLHGKWGWYKAGLVLRVLSLFGSILRVESIVYYYGFFGFVGSEATGVLFLFLYYRITKNILLKQDTDKQ